MRRRFLSRLAWKWAITSYHADLAPSLVVEVFPHGVFQHRLEVTVPRPGQLPASRPTGPAKPGWKIFLVRPLLSPRGPGMVSRLRRPLNQPVIRAKSGSEALLNKRGTSWDRAFTLTPTLSRQGRGGYAKVAASIRRYLAGRTLRGNDGHVRTDESLRPVYDNEGTPGQETS